MQVHTPSKYHLSNISVQQIPNVKPTACYFSTYTSFEVLVHRPLLVPSQCTSYTIPNHNFKFRLTVCLVWGPMTSKEGPLLKFACTTPYILSYHGATDLVVKGLNIVEDSLSHSDAPHSVELLWTSDQPDAETSTWQHITHDIHAPAGFEPTISTSERLQTHALENAPPLGSEPPLPHTLIQWKLVSSQLAASKAPPSTCGSSLLTINHINITPA